MIYAAARVAAGVIRNPGGVSLHILVVVVVTTAKPCPRRQRAHRNIRPVLPPPPIRVMIRGAGRDWRDNCNWRKDKDEILLTPFYSLHDRKRS